MKHFIIAYKYSNNNFWEIFEYVVRSDEEIKNVINDITILKNNNYLIRSTNGIDLEWLSEMVSSSKKEYYEDSITRKGNFILVEIKNHITNLFQRLKTFLEVNWIFDYSF